MITYQLKRYHAMHLFHSKWTNDKLKSMPLFIDTQRDIFAATLYYMLLVLAMGVILNGCRYFLFHVVSYDIIKYSLT